VLAIGHAYMHCEQLKDIVQQARTASKV